MQGHDHGFTGKHFSGKIVRSRQARDFPWWVKVKPANHGEVGDIGGLSRIDVQPGLLQNFTGKNLTKGHKVAGRRIDAQGKVGIIGVDKRSWRPTRRAEVFFAPTDRTGGVRSPNQHAVAKRTKKLGTKMKIV